MYRKARGLPISSVYDEEFIHLDLREDVEVVELVVEKPAAIQGPHQRG
jgi:hypothetical protein